MKKREKPNVKRTTIEIDSLSLSEGARKNTCINGRIQCEAVKMERYQDDGQTTEIWTTFSDSDSVVDKG